MENVGVVLPGGGSYCASQAGASKALYEYLTTRGARPRAVRGSSGGDLNSPMFVQAFADGGESIAVMEELWKNIKHRQVHTLIPHIYPRTTGIFKLTPLRKLLESRVDRSKLIHSGIDYKVRATKYGHGDGIEIGAENEHFYEMLCASASFPGMFKPQKIAGEFYSDAGISNNLPIARLISTGCTTIYILKTNPAKEKTLTKRDLRLLRIVSHVISEMMEANVGLQVHEIEYINQLVRSGAAPDKKEIRLIEIVPDVTHQLHVMDFNAKRCARSFDSGYRSARRQLTASH